MVIKIIFILILIVGLYFGYKKLKKVIMNKKDYNRKLSKEDLKMRESLSVLRKELMKTDNPNVRNEILNKIDILFKQINKNG